MQVLLEWKARYGRIFTVWLPYPMVVIGDHRVLQEHVVRNGDVFMAKKNPKQIMKMQSGGLYGLVFEDNAMVKEQRKFAFKSLHEIGFGSSALEDTVHNCAMEVVGRWRKSENEIVDLAANIEKAVGKIVWNVTFGIEKEFDDENVLEFRQLQRKLLPMVAGPLLMFMEEFPFIRKLDFLFNNQIKQVQEIIDKMIGIVKDAIRVTEKSYNSDDQPRSYVEAFLREMKKNEEGGKPAGNFTFRQMQSSTISLWGAGFESTVAILRLCCLQLVNHPDVQTKLQNEIYYEIGERRIMYEDQKLLPYTCAFLQEVYRIGNVLPINFVRQTTQETNIEGWPIAAGTNVLPQFSMVHSDPIEFERPDCFCPERHIDGDGRFVKDPRITPFSVGKRACLGEALARMEVFVMLATFVQNCHFTPVDKVPPPIEFDSGFSRAVKHFMVKIEPRN